MKSLLLTLPAICLALSACQPSEQEMPEDQGGVEAPSPDRESQDSGAGAGTATEPSRPATQAPPGGSGEPTKYAEAEILPTEGQTTGGLVKLTSTGNGVSIEGTVTGLEPGAHGFHIHEKGDCS
ncbi:MAG TPA: superoxide dismutase family protein, partial [Woeseiaceae bacterium]|nr:superoxide dismutase family protein [Woeseiaceae bacterium]